MAPVFTKKKATALEKDLLEAEQHIGTRLPAAYRRHLAKNNGGHPAPDLVVIQGRSGRQLSSDIAWFLNCGPYPHENLLQFFDTYRDRIPPNMLPIARNSGGSLFLMELGDEEDGAIYFWDRNDEADDGELPTTDNLYWLAPDFDAFLSCIRAP